MVVDKIGLVMKLLARGFVPLCRQENEKHWLAIREHLSNASLVGIRLQPFKEGDFVFCEYEVYDEPSLPLRERRCNQHHRARQIINSLCRQRTDAVRRKIEKAGFSAAFDLNNREH